LKGLLAGLLMRFLILLVFWPCVAAAAQFETFVLSEDPNVPVMVQLKGEIVEGDAAKFESITEGINKVTLILESPGGLVGEALRIGAAVGLNDFATMVVADTGCFSACGLIWLASSRRYMSASSRIGFHAAYRQVGDYLEESGQANAEIGSYLTHLGLRVEAIRFFTRSGPTELELLTPTLARALGIAIFLQNGTEVVTPWENPSVDRLAAEKVSLMVAGSACDDILGVSPDSVLSKLESIEAEGLSLVGDFWHELWLREIDRYKPTGTTYTMAHACLEAERVARQFGYQLVNSPSFDCSKAATPTEYTICADPDLRVEDRVMANLYYSILNSGNPKIQVSNFRSFHSDWFSRRNSCGSNSRCLQGTYEEVIELYGSIHMDPASK